MKRLIVALMLLLSSTAFAEDGWTPRKVREAANIDLFSNQVGYTIASGWFTGAAMAISTMQNLGFLGMDICMPAVSMGNFKLAVNSLDPTGLPETNDWGLIYLWYALANKFPCP